MPLKDGKYKIIINIPLLRAAMLLFSLCGLLSNCAVLNRLDFNKQAALRPMASPVGPSRRVVQQITALWPDRKETLLCVLELDKQHIAMAGLTNDGVSLFNLTYDGETIALDKSPLLPDSVAPEFIVTDLQLVYWPVAALQKSLRDSSWRLEVDISHRRLYYQGSKMVEVNYLLPDEIWPKSVELINHRQNYRLQIKTLSYETLSE
jgi:hypothetical protein